MTVWEFDPFRSVFDSCRAFLQNRADENGRKSCWNMEPDVVQKSAPAALFLQRVRQIFYICCSFLQILMLQYQLAQ